MSWSTFGRIADILSVISFLLSLGIFRRIYIKAETQKTTYAEERDTLLAHLIALQKNIWDDGLTSAKIQDTLQTKMFEYQMKYFFISSPRCIFHAFRCTHLLKNGIEPSNTAKIRNDINFLIARLSKKE